MGKLTIQNPDINERITIDGVEYHIGKNSREESLDTYMWNIYRKTDQKYFIGKLVLNRHFTSTNRRGKLLHVKVIKAGEVEPIHRCLMAIGLLNDTKQLIGVVRGCVRMNQI